MAKLTVESMAKMLGEGLNDSFFTFSDFMKTKAFKQLNQLTSVSFYDGTGFKFNTIVPGRRVDVFLPISMLNLQNVSGIDTRSILNIFVDNMTHKLAISINPSA